MRILSFTESARRLGRSPNHLRKLVNAGKIEAPFSLYDGGRPGYTEEYIEGLIAKRRKEANNGAS
jgi:hypothetical protein